MTYINPCHCTNNLQEITSTFVISIKCFIYLTACKGQAVGKTVKDKKKFEYFVFLIENTQITVPNKLKYQQKSRKRLFLRISDS